MNKDYINNLIANDIVDYGINHTTTFNYVVYLDEYVNKIDKSSKDYVEKNLNDIKEKLEKNNKVSDLYFNENDKSFDMVFYIKYVLNQVENLVYKNAELLEKKLSIDDVKNIAQELLDDDAFNDDMCNKIEYCESEYEL